MAKTTFRLSISSPGEDIPRLITASGRSCGGEFGLVLRPLTGAGVLVLDLGKQGVRWWKSQGTDVPQLPTDPTTLDAAVGALKGAKADLEPAGPVTLRGEWSGTLACDAEGRPTLTLTRKIASYGTLTLVSSPGSASHGLWTATVRRDARWFGEASERSLQATTLHKAIERGFGLMREKVAEACTTRDTTRRAARDADYAATHPTKPGRVAKDGTERFTARVDATPIVYLVGAKGSDAWAFLLRNKAKAERHHARLREAGLDIQLIEVTSGPIADLGSLLKPIGAHFRGVTQVHAADSLSSLQKATAPGPSRRARGDASKTSKPREPSPQAPRDAKPAEPSRRTSGDGTRAPRPAQPSSPGRRDASKRPKTPEADAAKDASLLDLFEQAAARAAKALAS